MFKLLEEADIIGAYKQAMKLSLVTQNYPLTVKLYSAAQSLAFKLSHVIDCITIAKLILQSDRLARDMRALMVTISKHICSALRHALLAPQAVHFRSGCGLILRQLQALETILHLNTAHTGDEGVSAKSETTKQEIYNSTTSEDRLPDKYDMPNNYKSAEGDSGTKRYML